MTKTEQHRQIVPSAQIGLRASAILLAALFFCLVLLPPPVASADSSFGEQGIGAGQIGGSADPIALSRQSGDVYLLDQGSQRIDQFSSAGTFVRSFGWGVADGAAELQSCGPGASPPTVTCTFGLAGSGAGQLNFPNAIAVDNDPASPSYGDVYVTNVNNRRVEKYGAAGEFLLAFGWGVADGAAEPQTCGPDASPPTATCQAALDGSGNGQFKYVGDWSAAAPIAVGAGGTVYVGSANRVQEFTPAGSYAGQIPLPAAPAGENDLATKLVLDDSCAQHEPPLTGLTSPTCAQFDPAAGDLYVNRVTVAADGSTNPNGVAGVQRLDPSGTVLETLDAAGSPQRLAIDEAGHLYLGEPTEEGSAYEFREYLPSGALLALFSSPQVVFFTGGGRQAAVGGVAVGNAAGVLFATNQWHESTTSREANHVAVVDIPQPGPPTVKPGSAQATEIEPQTATLNAVVNAHGHPSEVHFDYITQKKYEEDGDSFGAGTESTAEQSIGLLIHEQPASALAAGLTPETAYRFRAVVENSEAEEAIGEAASFTSRPPVTVEELTTDLVAAETVRLKASVDPNGSPTGYTFQYGPDTSYGAGAVEGRLPISTNPTEVSATFEHLTPDTTYHYRLLAHNSFGPVEMVGGAFTTEQTLAESAAAQHCPNARLREEDDSQALPECRAYEMVSPPQKEGYGVAVNAGGNIYLGSTGERALFTSTGAFAGANASHSIIRYLAQRTPGGWQTIPAGMPASATRQPAGPYDFTASLDSWLNPVPFTSSSGNSNGATSGAIFLGHAQGGFTQASPLLELPDGTNFLSNEYAVTGQSADLSTLYLTTGLSLLPGDPRPSVEGSRDRIYEITGAAGPSPTLSLAAEVPTGLPLGGSCEVDRWIARASNLVSADGSTLFFTAPLDEHPGQACDFPTSPGPNKSALFARLAQAAPVQLSRAPASQCSAPACTAAAHQNALFQGAAADGSLAWFTTTQPLIDADTDEADDLYLAKLEAGQVKELVQASGGGHGDPHPGQGAGVQGVVQVSEDGERAYFVATGLLTTDPNGLGQSAAQGADNLYLYEAQSGATKFLARLCSGPRESGSLADPACGPNLDPNERAGAVNDSGLWNSIAFSQAQLTPDGRYLLFSTYAGLIESGPEADTDTARDVYRYDSQTGQIVRVSVGRDGNDGNGNDSRYDALIAVPSGLLGNSDELQQQAEDETRAISADGSTVVFATAAPLAGTDQNTGARPSCGLSAEVGTAGPTGCDVYEWHQGQVSLISDGLDPHGALHSNEPTAYARLDPSGRDILFATARALTPSDRDGTADVYDARVGGGFPAPATLEPPCEGAEACHGKATEASLHPAYTSEETHGAGNPPRPLRCAKGRHRVKKHGEFRCVPNKPHKHHHKKPHKRANTNRRAGK